MPDRLFLGRYQSVRLLGEGGMSQIYLARSGERPEDEVVVKLLLEPRNEKARKHFQREIHVLSQIQHRHAVVYIDSSLDDPLGPCLVMEYVRGVELADLLADQKPFSPLRAGALLAQLCDLLTTIHGQGILHRDLKPSNLMVVHPGTPQETLKVMDFGLAQLSSNLYLAPEQVAENRIVAAGTPQYICPEQVRGETMDARGDLYSVGVLLFEMLTGRLPFAYKSREELLSAHEKEAPPTFRAVGAPATIPPAVEAVVQACLNKSPDGRPHDAAELARRYEEALGHKLTATSLKASTGGSSQKHVPLRIKPRSDPSSDDPRAVIYKLDVCMPESIAMLKLCGFFHDLHGEIVESVPGMIRVQIAEGGTPAAAPTGLLSWFGGGGSTTATPGRVTEMLLYMEKTPGGSPNSLSPKLSLRRKGKPESQTKWRTRCEQLFHQLQAYLISRS
jgi:serine/threonine protein kinase